MLPIADLLTSGGDALMRPDASVRTHARTRGRRAKRWRRRDAFAVWQQRDPGPQRNVSLQSMPGLHTQRVERLRFLFVPSSGGKKKKNLSSFSETCLYDET